jgi:uncharacterized protein DUF6178
MAKPARRDRRRVTNATPRPLLARILDTPHLAHVVPRLQPELLHRVIQHCGLEDCGELVALATAEQLTRVFDLDLWRSPQPGLEEQFDADRFGVWLEVLIESGAAFAAQRIAELDVDLVIAALGQHVRVFDPASLSPLTGTAADEAEIGGYVVLSRRTDSWDAIVELLLALDADHGEQFHRVMRGCRAMSNSDPEIDGLDDLLTEQAQVMFDLALDREQRRQHQGYLAPDQARAFLAMSRQLRLDQDAAPSASPTATAYFRAVNESFVSKPSDQSSPTERSDEPLARADSAAAVAAVVDILFEAGVLPQRPRALLQGAGGPAPRLAQIQACLRVAGDRAPAAYSMRNEELAYLANAILAGCSIQARPFTPQEASDAAVAVCNLGLENWPPQWPPASAPSSADPRLPDEFLISQDLVRVFQVGWTVLHQQVCLYAAERLVGVLNDLRCEDTEVQADLDALRTEMGRHWRDGAPWRARDALDVITILDMPTWAALLGLTGECPVIHAGLEASRRSAMRAVSASAFEFISENSQIALVREFMESLPERLSG